jgi:hypothetical protein
MVTKDDAKIAAIAGFSLGCIEGTHTKNQMIEAFREGLNTGFKIANDKELSD